MSSTSSKNTTGTTTSNTSPWAPQASALQSAFGNAQNAFNTTNAQVGSGPTDFTAQFTPDQLATFRSMIGYGNNNSLPGQVGNAAGGALTSGTGALDSSLSGLTGFNANAGNNPSSLIQTANQFVQGQNIPAEVRAAMQGAEEAGQQANAGIDQAAANSGNADSSRAGIAQGLVDRAVAEQAGNLTGSLSSNAFQQGLNLASNNAAVNNSQNLGALTSLGGLGNAATGTGISGAASSIGDQGNLFSLLENAGSGQQAANQANLTNLLQRYQFGQQAPWTPLQNLMGIIGSNNWGSNTTGTTNSTTTSTPSTMSQIGSGIGALGSVLGMFGL